MTDRMMTGYSVEFDGMEPQRWYATVAAFPDANLYQLWQQGAGRARFTSVSRMLLKQGQQNVAAAEVRLIKPPLLRGGVAYALWGPLCGWNAEPTALQQALRAMRQEYVVRRGMVLRINPRLLQDDQIGLAALEREGFSRLSHVRTKRTLIVDLDPTIDELRRDLDKKWRNCLSKSERSGLTIEAGTDVALFDRFLPVYEAMLDRKGVAPSADIEKHRRIQAALPEELKMRVVLACCDGQPCAGAIYSALGDTAVYLFGGTDASGMRTSASYIVHWTIIQDLKGRGVRHYDLNGIDPDANPGTYHFKRGLAGKAGRDVMFAGQFQAANRSLGSFSVLALEKLRSRLRAGRTPQPAVVKS